MELSKTPDWREDKSLFFYLEESGHIDCEVFKNIVLAEPLDDKINTILHENLWDLYETLSQEEIVTLVEETNQYKDIRLAAKRILLSKEISGSYWDMYEEIFMPDLVDNRIGTCEKEKDKI